MATDTVIDAGHTLIVGAGLAGLFTALASDGPVTILAASPLGLGASSTWAQGGVAAALGPDDSAKLHAADTIAAGAGIVDPRIARILAEEAAARIEDLARLGVPFDRDGWGGYVLGREAAHQRNRIVRVKGDRAGAAIMEALLRAVRQTPRIRVLEGFRAFKLLVEDGRVTGVWATPLAAPNTAVAIAAGAVVFALGGSGGLFAVTTNPPQAQGQAIAMAALAGALISDPEFVQFHPTAIHVGRDPAPLATEALRGEGAVLVNDLGEPFMKAVHPLGDLAPRDVVARGIFRQIKSGRRAYIDARKAIGAKFPNAFPTVYAACSAHGIDPVSDLIPVAPAAHYHMGGIAVDEQGRTSLPGLWAVGECAATGAHGANRLASNSLLEAVVFGHRVARSLVGTERRPRRQSPVSFVPSDMGTIDVKQLRGWMTAHVGLERSGEGLATALKRLREVSLREDLSAQARNTVITALIIAAAAYQRTESRGGHYRSDYRQPLDAWAHRTYITLPEAQGIAERALAERNPATLGIESRPAL